MKMNKRKVFTLALAVCLIAILSMGSLAWFSDSDSVVNDFLIAGSDDDTADEVFSVQVWEENDPEDDGLEFVDILPGDTLEKVAHVQNTGYYDQYIRVTITVSDADAWMAVYGGEVEITKLVNGIDTAKLYGMESKVEGENLVYVLYYEDVLVGNQGSDFVVFNSVNIPESVTQEQAAMFNADGHPSFTISVKADAIQTQNVGDNVFDAFATVGMNPNVDTVYVSDFAEMQAAIEKHDNITVVLVDNIVAG